MSETSLTVGNGCEVRKVDGGRKCGEWRQLNWSQEDLTSKNEGALAMALI